MSVWMVMGIWGGLVNLAVVLINWRGRSSYERTRAASVVVIARSVRVGGIVREERPDGTGLHIEIPGPCPERETVRSPRPPTVGACVARRR